MDPNVDLPALLQADSNTIALQFKRIDPTTATFGLAFLAHPTRRICNLSISNLDRTLDFPSVTKLLLLSDVFNPIWELNGLIPPPKDQLQFLQLPNSKSVGFLFEQALAA